MFTKLTDFQAEELLIEIITGKKLFCLPSGDIMAVRFPTTEEKDMARIIYARSLRSLKASGVPEIEQMRLMIKELELLPKNFYALLERTKTELEAYKKAYETTTSAMQRQSLMVDMERLESSLLKQDSKERAILCNTAEVQAENVKIDYMVSRCTLYGDALDKQYWNTYDAFCQSSDVKIVSVSRYNFMILMAGIPASTIRAVARTQEWRNRWKSLKETGTPIFSGASAEWDRNKVAICYWSDFYDSVYGYHTPPPDEILGDDEKLFDWIRDVNRINSAKTGKKKPGQESDSKRVKTPYKVRPKGK